MAATWVLKFPQVDKAEQPILVHVTQKQGTVSDLDLLATDGEEAYRGKVRQRHLFKLKSPNYEGSDDEWASLIQYALVSRQGHSIPEEQTRNLEIDCAISKRESKTQTLTITLRSRIEDITHKLGTIELSYSEDTDDVDLFGWACRLADQRDELQTQATTTKQEAEDYTTSIARLEAQLADLVKAKKEHEDQLLTKFAMLLNEKKAKIRDQQRVLQTANIDQKKLSEIQLKINRKQGTSAHTKRKRNDGRTEGDDDVLDESDGFDSMEVDKEPDDEDRSEVESGKGTPPRSRSPESQTASEDEASVGPSKLAGTSKPKTATGREAPSPPPQRSLPFQRKGQKPEKIAEKKALSPPSHMEEDEETASEDDEL